MSLRGRQNWFGTSKYVAASRNSDQALPLIPSLSDLHYLISLATAALACYSLWSLLDVAECSQQKEDC